MPESLAESGEILVGEARMLAVKIELPQAPLLLLVAPKGYVACGYLNIDTAEKLGQAAAMVKGVKSFEDVLEASITAVTTKARELGIRERMSGREALKLMG